MPLESSHFAAASSSRSVDGKTQEEYHDDFSP